MSSPTKRPRLDEPSSPTEIRHALAALSCITSVVADTGELTQIRKFQPDDATTNPSLMLQAVTADPSLIDRAILVHKAASPKKGDGVEEIIDDLTISLGSSIAGLVPGRVSTEVDARLSFDAAAMVKKAEKLIEMYQAKGIGKERVLIKLATTWEGVEACRELQKRGIDCNMTLLFGFGQAVAAAEAGAWLISPFVGRIWDWHQKNALDTASTTADPGVLSVQRIYNFYKRRNYPTIVMGASFRSIKQILGLAGCDKLTIAPKLLEELRNTPADAVVRKLSEEDARGVKEAVDDGFNGGKPVDEEMFRWLLNEDPMATEKLAEGIRLFNKDGEKLRELVRIRLTKFGK